MDDILMLFKRIEGLKDRFTKITYRGGYTANDSVKHLILQYQKDCELLKQLVPNLFADFHIEQPKPWSNDSSQYNHHDLEPVISSISYILKVGSSYVAENNIKVNKFPKRIFISHGRSNDWLKVQAHLEKDLNYSTLELAQEPNLGRTVLQKLNDESNRCSYAVIVMTGDDKVEDQVRARENVIHEIGWFQAKYGLKNVAVLHEEGVNQPSNIHGLVYFAFPKGYVEASFNGLDRELKIWVSS